MREYGTIYANYWPSTLRQGFSDDAKLLGTYLMTCGHGSIAGVFRLPDGYASEDLGWIPERVSQRFGELSVKGFANRCETTKWVWIRNFLNWNEPANPNGVISIRKAADQIPTQCEWRIDFTDFLAEAIPRWMERFAKGSKTVKQPSRNNNPTQPNRTTTHERDARANASGVLAVPRGTRQRLPVDLDDLAWIARLKAAYPQGLYPQSDWLLGEREARQRLDDGDTPDALVAGCERYAAQCAATGKVGTQFILSPRKFFALPECRYREAWSIPQAATESSRANTEAASLQKLKDRRKAIGLADFRDPGPNESAEQYRIAQDAEWTARQPRDLGRIAGNLATKMGAA